MGQKEKLLSKARRNQKSLRFEEFENLLRLCNWEFRRQSGSHRLWYSSKGYRLPIQPTKNSQAKSYQVKQFLEQYDREENEQ
ncbi:MAG: type II toxin-antitoxin system HicA family toxin [Xenococcaceae cyanobacterium]